MPGYDGTGPSGQGPMTGRGMGYCVIDSAPGSVNPRFGRGMGRGCGFGRGRGFRWRQMPGNQQPVQEQPINGEETMEDKRKAIAQEIHSLEQGLAEFKRRLKELR